jgi:hypothetical protein
MRDTRLAAATKVATQLFETERALDELLACAARLTASLPEARIEARLSGVMGQSAIESASQLLNAVANARGITVALHAQLDELKNDIGLRTVGMGGGFYKGSAQQPGGERHSTEEHNIMPLQHVRAAA